MFLLTSQSVNYFLRSAGFQLSFRRLKSKKASNKNACTRALAHFDDFYKVVFNRKWPSVRLGLLSKGKKVAVINNFGDAEKTEELLLHEGAFHFKFFLETEKTNLKTFEENDALEQENRETDLKDIIEKQMKKEEEKELKLLHPEGMKLKSKVECLNHDSDEEVSGEGFEYDLNNTISSMHSDLASAKIDTSRLIMPGSKLDEAALFDFVPVTELRGTTGFVPESEYYKYYEGKSDKKINVEKEHEIDFPEHLKVFSFDRGDVTDFPNPTKCVNDVWNFIQVDGAELLTALALGVKPEDHVLDMCSSSGNIAYCIFQTLYPKILVCKKTKVLENLFKESLFDYSAAWKNMLLITEHHFDVEQNQGLFDKILVNVPSTDDKYCVFNTESNIFQIKHLKFRLKLPELQAALLVKALKLVRPGGAVLYSTSTLSPVQNDGVVNEALRVVGEETTSNFTVKDLSPALAQASSMYNFGDYLNLKFGTLVVPFVPMNFGPRYFCKIVKNEE